MQRRPRLTARSDQSAQPVQNSIRHPTGDQKRATGTTAQACAVCYQKKIRCDVSRAKPTCSNCALYQVACEPRLRKRKRNSQAANTSNTTTASSTATVYSTAHIVTPTTVPPTPVSSRHVHNPASCTQYYGPSPDRDHDDHDGDGGGQVGGVPAREEAQDGEEEGDDEEEEEEEGGGGGGGEQQHATPTSQVQDGRSIYFSAAMQQPSAESRKAYPDHGASPSDKDMMAVLHMNGAFDLPGRALRTCYMDNFFTHCTPWIPVVERSWLDHDHDKNGSSSSSPSPSPLLLQAVLLVGSRVTQPVHLEASRVMYTRAKALFLSGHEQNPVVLIITSLLMQWWNPTGPERISVDNSTFWLRTGVGIALQIGLHQQSSRRTSRWRDEAFRRRLWWSLVARDCQVSAAHGRPRSIQMDDFQVPPLTIEDFPRISHGAGGSASISVHFISISRIFGDVGESYRRGTLNEARATQLRNDLYYWIRELPRELRLFHQDGGGDDDLHKMSSRKLRPYNLAARHLHIIYFVVLIMLLRKSRPPHSVTEASSLLTSAGSSSPMSSPVGSLVAASFVAGIFDEMMVRDEVRLLGPAIFKFFLLTAGIVLMTATGGPPSAVTDDNYDDVDTQNDNDDEEYTNGALQDLNTIRKALEQFAIRYPSALATSHTLDALARSHRGSRMTATDLEVTVDQPPPSHDGQRTRAGGDCDGGDDDHDEVRRQRRRQQQRRWQQQPELSIPIPEGARPLFREFGPGLCSQWGRLFSRHDDGDNANAKSRQRRRPQGQSSSSASCYRIRPDNNQDSDAQMTGQDDATRLMALEKQQATRSDSDWVAEQEAEGAQGGGQGEEEEDLACFTGGIPSWPATQLVQEDAIMWMVENNDFALDSDFMPMY